MMKGFLRWLATSLGYLLYTVLVVLLLLWVLLPADSIRLWLQGQLNAASSGLRWEIKKLDATLPPGLVAKGIILRQAGETGTELFKGAELTVRPDLRALIATKGEMPFRYQLKVLDGNLQGKGVFVAPKNLVRCEGEAANLKLDLLAPIWTGLGRTASGRLSGRFRFDGAWRDPYQGVMQADLQVADGSVSLQQPVFGLNQLDFSQLSGSLELKERALALNEGKIESRMLAGEFKGTVSLASTLALSEVKIEGDLEPRSELLAGLDSEAVSLIKQELKDNRLSFTVSGSMVEPGIQFHGLSGIIEGILQGGGGQR